MFVFANGCFWGSEKGVWRLPGGGIYATAVGYAGGFTPNPTYEEPRNLSRVCEMSHDLGISFTSLEKVSVGDHIPKIWVMFK